MMLETVTLIKFKTQPMTFRLEWLQCVDGTGRDAFQYVQRSLGFSSAMNRVQAMEELGNRRQRKTESSVSLTTAHLQRLEI